jgi:two-component system, OmpR family, response regulator MtrA
MRQRVLVVEDDASIREVVKLGLERAGFEVEAAPDGRRGLDAFEARRPDAVVLDLMLPEIDGLELCRRMRVGSGVPIVILSARDDTTDVIVGLEMGADDYLTKPFQPSELVARLRAVLRRAASFDSGDVLAVGGLEIDVGAYRARGPDGELALTATEFRLLCELARRRNQVFTRQLLLELVWGYDHLGDSRMVDAAVQRLRAKLDGSGVGITAVRGVGYRLEAT